VNENAQNPLWKAIGYCGPDPVTTSATLTPKPLENSIIDVCILSSEDLNMALKTHGIRLADASSVANETVKSRDHVLECDVVIVGSGSGGGVAAAVLAKAGFKVIILEKGGYMARQDLSLLEREAVRDLYEEGKILSTDDQRMLVFAGSTVGGGSAVNWSASLRTPDHVLREWNEELNLPLFGSQRYRDAMDEVCKRLGVQGEIDNENFQNTVLRTGCEKLGYHVANIPINATPDHYCGWCTFGCRKGMKQGTSETWLVDAAHVKENT
jgi:long-chain-alcohol oxidase